MKYSKQFKNEAVMLFYFVRIVKSSELIIYIYATRVQQVTTTVFIK